MNTIFHSENLLRFQTKDKSDSLFRMLHRLFSLHCSLLLHIVKWFTKSCAQNQLLQGYIAHIKIKLLYGSFKMTLNVKKFLFLMRNV